MVRMRGGVRVGGAVVCQRSGGGDARGGRAAAAGTAGAAAAARPRGGCAARRAARHAPALRERRRHAGRRRQHRALLPPHILAPRPPVPQRASLPALLQPEQRASRRGGARRRPHLPPRRGRARNAKTAPVRRSEARPERPQCTHPPARRLDAAVARRGHHHRGRNRRHAALAPRARTQSWTISACHRRRCAKYGRSQTARACAETSERGGRGVANAAASVAAVHGGRACAGGARGGRHAADAQQARGTAAGPPRASPPQGGARDLPAETAVRGLCGGWVERLDRCTARVRGVLLPGRLPVPAGGPLERHEPCDRPDAGQLREPSRRTQGVLRAHAAHLHFHALFR